MNITWVMWMVILTLAEGILIAFKIIDKRNGKKFRYNPHPPGEADTCRNHGEAIASIKTDITNIKDDIKRIERKLDRGK